MKELVYNKTIPVQHRETRFYQIKAWSDDTVEVRKLGYGSRVGWTMTARIVWEPVGLEWDPLSWSLVGPDVRDGHDTQFLTMFEEKFMQWLTQHAEQLQQERIDAEYDWSLL